jgi:hypothetical protein
MKSPVFRLTESCRRDLTKLSDEAVVDFRSLLDQLSNDPVNPGVQVHYYREMRLSRLSASSNLVLIYSLELPEVAKQLSNDQILEGYLQGRFPLIFVLGGIKPVEAFERLKLAAETQTA